MPSPRLLGAAAVLALTSASTGGVIYVDDDAPAAGDGLGWNTAFRFLRDALVAAGNDAEVRVGQGVYRPDRAEADPDGSGDRNAAFPLANGVAIVGGWAGLGAPDPDARDVAEYETILSGDLAGDDGPDFANDGENSYHVLIALGVDASAVLDGFTIRDGHADGSPYPRATGGGMFVELASPTIRRCTFADNRARVGGGIDLRGSQARIEDCRFVGNLADDGDGGAHVAQRGAERGNPHFVRCEFRENHGNSYGGGLGTSRGTLTVVDCTFIDNTTERRGGGVFFWDVGRGVFRGCTFIGNRTTLENPSSCTYGAGGAMYLYHGDIDVVDCTFVDNESTGCGGGVFATRYEPIRFVGCTFVGNRAGRRGGGLATADHVVVDVVTCRFLGNVSDATGGGIDLGHECTPRVLGCEFSGNEADTGGAIALTSTYEATVAGCTMAGNVAHAETGGLWVGPYGGIDLLAANNVIWGNVDPSGPTETAQVRVQAPEYRFMHNCVAAWSGGLGGVGNISGDPRLADPDGADDVPGTEDDDLRLTSGSSAIDAGVNTAVPADDPDLDDDGDRAERLALDVAGRPRFADDPATKDSGCGAPVVVDIGAHEAEGTPAPPVLVGDIDGDGTVAFTDLLRLLAAWGPCDACCPADLDLSRDVGFDDVLMVLGAWR